MINVLLTFRVHDVGERNNDSGSWIIARDVSWVANALFAALFVFALLHLLHERFRHLAKGPDLSRYHLTMMVIYLSIASINVFTNLVTLVLLPDLRGVSQTGLILDLGLLFASNMLVFSLWYQIADLYLPGGAFDFPPNAADPDDPPRWVDYVALSFFTQSTFGPTLEGVRTRPVKVLLMIQTSLSLVVLVVLFARIITPAGV
ncbi:unannotated protein [freshwater metagenome]|uniref:Unannotated protein n=1 Tax=freshwater metagenome TaxID=449393 RepID=A0A6J7EAL3_9ZZZZ